MYLVCRLLLENDALTPELYTLSLHDALPICEPPRAPGKQPEFWLETVSWEWQFKGGDAWLKVAFDKSKNFSGGELRYLADKEILALVEGYQIGRAHV